MAVYYYKLWKLLKERGISKSELACATKLTKTPLRNMQNGGSVSVETLDRICDYLTCDFGDIITNIPEEPIPISTPEHSVFDNNIVRALLVEHMNEHELTLSMVCSITTISINTLKSFLNGNDISHKTYTKLLALGKDFQNRLVQNIDSIDREEQKVTYCTACKTHRKKCFALKVNLNGNAHEPICLLKHDLHSENNTVFTYDKCPRPSNIRDFTRNASDVGKKI